MPAPRIPDPFRPAGPARAARPEETGRDRPDPAFWGDETPPRRPGRPPGVPGLVERWLDLARAHRFEVRGTVAIVVLVALVAGFAWFRVGSASSEAPPPSPADASGAPGGSGLEDASADLPAATGERGATITVHVAGAVQKPGVVELPAGARVIDALETVGGALADADLDRLNLAAKVVDGQQILVPKVGQALPAPVLGGAPSATAGGPINLNLATAAELETLPGIGPVLAAAIVSERERRGGFRSVNELRQVRGIGDARFTDLKALVTV